jgi:ketosteroid isomerase-like protein
MSRENVEGYRQAVDAFNRRDRAAFLAWCDPELENVPSRYWPESESIRGREAVWDFLVGVNEPWEESRFECFELMDAGTDKVVADLRSEMRGKASEIDVNAVIFVAVTVRDGLITRMDEYVERKDALEAAGLEE